jgi:alpha-tubulin suppressor-like RCC1 family protein
VSLAITTVPPGVQCIQITATGSYTVSQNFPATPDAGTAGALSLGELPLGSVAITGQAFNAACAGIGSQQPSWVADKQVVTLHEGVITWLTMTFRPDNPVTATPNFVGNVVQVAVGAASIAAVLSDGTVEAAGNFAGLYNAPVFGVVPGLSNVAQIASSLSDFWHCALLKNGTVVCWGSNNYGQLGNGTTTSSTSAPVPVTGLTNVVQLSAGGDHACAVQSGGNLYCWGNNTNGQIGNNATTNVLAPVQVPLSTGSNPVLGVSCGGFHTCAVNIYGFVYCWGANGFGQIGNNTTTEAHAPVDLYPETFEYVQLALGYQHTCGLRADGSVFCWGANPYGGLGTGNFNSALVPTQAMISNAQQIAPALYNTCARRSDGTVWCWGSDYNGTNGDGTGASASTPLQVPGLPPSTGIAAASFTVCSVGSDLSIECWGDNSYGQLGNGTMIEGFLPAPLKL